MTKGKSRPITIIEAYGPNEGGNLRRVNVATSTQFSKGFWIYASGTNIGLAAVGSENTVLTETSVLGNAPLSMALGVLEEGKESSDTTTNSLSAVTDAIIRANASGAIEVGEAVVPSGESFVIPVRTLFGSTMSNAIVGLVPQMLYAQETAANGGQVRCRMVI